MPGTPGVPSQSWYANANLPTELMQWNPFGTAFPDYFVSEATLTYTADWDPQATYWQAAYWFTAHAQHPTNNVMYEFSGIGWVGNAYVDPTPVIRVTHMYTVGIRSIFHVLFNSNGRLAMLSGEDTTTSGVTQWYNALGVPTLLVTSNAYLSGSHKVVGGAILSWSSFGAFTPAIGSFPSVSI